MKHAVAVIVTFAACARTAAPSPPLATPTIERAAPLPISDPDEYQLGRVSRAAGEAIFVETGLGDPYGTGIAYPIWLGLLDGYPQLFGATPEALATRFGFVARPGKPLPLGMHLTTDPFTGVPFVVTSCALCHAERIRWAGGEALVIGLGNKHVKIHAYDRAFAAVLAEPGFSAARLGLLADAAAARAGIAWPMLYRDALVGATVAALRARATERVELHARTRADPPGRVAVIESFRAASDEVPGRSRRAVRSRAGRRRGRHRRRLRARRDQARVRGDRSSVPRRSRPGGRPGDRVPEDLVAARGAAGPDLRQHADVAVALRRAASCQAGMTDTGGGADTQRRSCGCDAARGLLGTSP